MGAIVKTIKAQKTYLANRVNGGSLKMQDACLEPGATYMVTITKVES